MSRIVYALAVMVSHVEAWVRRFDMMITPRPRANRHDVYKCVLCGGPMRSDRRPARDVRMPNGDLRHLPEEELDWYRCERCRKNQIGVRAA